MVKKEKANNRLDYILYLVKFVMETISSNEEQILNDIRGIPPNLLPKISKLIHFMKNEMLNESEKTAIDRNKFISLEGIFQGKIEHTDEEIKAVRLKFKET